MIKDNEYIEYFARVIGDSDCCPRTLDCMWDKENRCTKCWVEALKGYIEDYEKQVLQLDKDSTEYIEYFARVLGNSDCCPQTLGCMRDIENGCTKCWVEALKGYIEDYEKQVLQLNQDTTKKG